VSERPKERDWKSR